MGERIRLLMHVLPVLGAGGVESWIADTSECIQTDVDKVYLVCGKVSSRLSKKRLEAVGVHVVDSGRSRLAEFGSLLRLMRRYRDEFTDVVIHVHAPARQGVVVPLLRVLGYRTLVHSHSAAWSSYRYTNIFKRVSLWIASVSASQLVACSNEAAKFAFGGRACAQVDNPVDLKRFKFSDVHRYRIRNTHGISGSLVFGYVGRLSQVKNLDVLIVACADMLKRNRRVMLVIVGDGPERAPLKKLALDLDISRNVIFTGEVAQPGHYYSAIDVFCLPSTAEGFGTSLVEAQASGLRCVVSASMTRAACATDLVRFVQDQSNPLAWTRVLSEIDDLPPCYSADRLSTYGGLERFSAPKISQRMLKLYGWEPRPGNTVRYGK